MLTVLVRAEIIGSIGWARISDDQKGAVRITSDGGISGEHDSPEPFEFLVGPTTSDQFNTARLRLIPIACWRVDDIRFSFGSSFVDAEK